MSLSAGTVHSRKSQVPIPSRWDSDPQPALPPVTAEIRIAPWRDCATTVGDDAQHREIDSSIEQSDSSWLPSFQYVETPCARPARIANRSKYKHADSATSVEIRPQEDAA